MNGTSHRLGFDDFVLDLDGRTLERLSGDDVLLTTAEFDLLATFVRAPGRVLSREYLRLSVAGRSIEAFDRSVDVLVGRLRRKIERDVNVPSLIITLTRAGYKFTPRVSFVASSDPIVIAPPEPPERLSLAVLPFDNLTNDPGQDYFVDGVVEEIIAALSCIRWFVVIARSSSFTYKGRAVSATQVGQELGVRYVLTGSMRKLATRIRITTCLVDAETGVQVWTDRFDGSVEDVFDFQDAITANVAGAIEPQLLCIEAARVRRQRPENPTAYDCFLRGLAQFYTETKATIGVTLQLLYQAMEADPGYAPPYALAAECLVYRIDYGWSDDRSTDKVEAARLADAALERDHEDATVLVLAAHVLAYARHDYVTPRALLERALTFNPNLALAFQLGGWVNLYAGDAAGAVDWFNRGKRLSPLDARNFIYYSGLAYALIMIGRDQEALEWANKAVASNPSWMTGWRALASALVHLGRVEEAMDVGARIRREVPEYRISNTRELMRRTPGLERYLQGLRCAGLPE